MRWDANSLHEWFLPLNAVLFFSLSHTERMHFFSFSSLFPLPFFSLSFLLSFLPSIPIQRIQAQTRVTWTTASFSRFLSFDSKLDQSWKERTQTQLDSTSLSFFHSFLSSPNYTFAWLMAHFYFEQRCRYHPMRVKTATHSNPESLPSFFLPFHLLFLFFLSFFHFICCSFTFFSMHIFLVSFLYERTSRRLPSHHIFSWLQLYITISILFFSSLSLSLSLSSLSILTTTSIFSLHPFLFLLLPSLLPSSLSSIFLPSFLTSFFLLPWCFLFSYTFFFSFFISSLFDPLLLAWSRNKVTRWKWSFPLLSASHFFSFSSFQNPWSKKTSASSFRKKMKKCKEEGEMREKLEVGKEKRGRREMKEEVWSKWWKLGCKLFERWSLLIH